MRVVGRRGACRIEDITSAARVAKGTLYLYFPSWEDLLVAMRQRLLDQYAREVEEKFAGASQLDWRARSESECVRFVEFVVGLGRLHTALFHGAIADRPIEKDRSARQLIARILQRGVEVRAIDALDIEASAGLLFAVLHSTADQIARGGDKERLLGVMLELVRRWLFVKHDQSGDVN